MLTRPVLLVLARLAMEGAWLTALVAFFSLMSGAPRSAMPALAVCVLLLAAYGAGYLLQHLDLEEGQLRLLGMALAVAAVNGMARLLVTGRGDFWDLGWPPAYVGGGAGAFDQGRQTVLTLGLGIVIWWRGLRLAEDLPTFDSVLGAFRSGVVLVTIQALLEGFVAMADGASFMAVPFFMASLLALALAHLERVDHGRNIGLRGMAGLLPLSTILAICVAGLVLAFLPYGELSGVLVALAKVVEFATTIVFFEFLLAAGLLAELLINALNWLLSFINRDAFQIQLPNEQGLLANQQQAEGSGIPTWVLDTLRVTIFGSIALVVLVVLALAFRRRLSGRGESLTEERDSLWESGRGSGELPGWVQRVLSGLLGRGAPGAANLEGILRLYFGMVQHAARVGIVREQWRTPFEFQGRLGAVFAGREEEVGRITHAFAAARYGNLIPPPDQLQELEGDYQRLREPPAAPGGTETAPLEGPFDPSTSSGHRKLRTPPRTAPGE
ncbi:MAG: DUF4129 domain-containing protein [Chloroflexi bacterium]|nr:DUF4129 domain-containing protein [Chloroflexota bacterium]